MWWPFNLIFGSDSESPAAIVADAMTVVFAPQRGVDKKKMMKELQSILGKDGKNVITSEDVAHLHLSYSVMSEGIASDIEQAYELFDEWNRGRNGDISTILSKNGLKQLAKFGPLDDEEVPFLQTKFGWKVYITDRDIAKTAEESFINQVVQVLPKYFNKTGEEEVLGIKNQCGCGVSFREHAWLFRHSYRDGQISCPHCGTPVKAVDGDWAKRMIKKIEELEAKEGISLISKEMKAA